MLSFTWLYDTVFPFIGRLLGIISSFACSSYDTVAPILQNFFSSPQIIQYTNVFTGAPSSFVFMSSLPRVLNAIFNIASKVIWWLLNLVIKVFGLGGQPFVFAVFSAFAVFFVPFFGLRFVRMLIS